MKHTEGIATPQDKSYFMNIAKAVSERSTCFLYKEGAVLVSKEGNVISTGYNGAVHGCVDCWKNGICSYEVETGQKSDCSQEQCMGLHAEVNALLNAHKEDTKDSILYIYGEDRQTGKPANINVNGVVGHIIQACNVKEIVTEAISQCKKSS